jgi:hypothetical protein
MSGAHHSMAHDGDFLLLPEDEHQFYLTKKKCQFLPRLVEFFSFAKFLMKKSNFEHPIGSK